MVCINWALNERQKRLSDAHNHLNINEVKIESNCREKGLNMYALTPRTFAFALIKLGKSEACDDLAL